MLAAVYVRFSLRVFPMQTMSPTSCSRPDLRGGFVPFVPIWVGRAALRFYLFAGAAGLAAAAPLVEEVVAVVVPEVVRVDFETPLPESFRMEVAPGNVAEIVAPGEFLGAEAFAAPQGRQVQKLEWNEAAYRRTRLTRGVEGRSTSPRVTREGWYGLRFRVAPNWPMEKRGFFAQMICWTPEFPRTNKTVALAYDGEGGLWLNGFYGDVEESERYNSKPDKTVKLALGRLEPGRWHTVVMQVRYSRSGDGFARAWLDVEADTNGVAPPPATAEMEGVKLGNGAWVSDTEMRHGSYQKWGVYAHDSARYTRGETRTLFYDEIAFAVGESTDGWRLVWPGLGGEDEKRVSVNE